MTSIEIVRYILGNHFFVCLQQIKVSTSHSCGDLETDVEQLAQTAVVGIRTGIVPECGGELLGRPPPNVGRRGKLGCVDVDDCEVRVTQLFAVRIGLGVDLFGEREALSLRFGKPYDLFEPRRPSRVE
jgi:hypothetical protein